MKVLILGAGGQLGRELQVTVPVDAELVALDSADCDVTDRSSVEAVVAREEPAVILNAAAYTAVDKAESEPEEALAVNAVAVEHIAIAAKSLDARLIHISTDFVFDGRAEHPIPPESQPAPIGVYGQTKLEGESNAMLAGEGNFVILRTSWVYSQFGQSFVKTMLRLMKERDSLRVVDDQVGSPTYAKGLAQVCWRFATQNPASGTFHWSDGGKVSWHGFALEIQHQAIQAGLLKREIPIEPITGSEYAMPARRPGYSVLDCSSTVDVLGLQQVAWQENLRKMILEMVG